MKRFKPSHIVILALIVFAFIFPLIIENMYFLRVMSLAFIYIIAIYGMNLLAGFTGYLSLAHAGFFAVGAYAFGIFTTRYEISYWVAFFFAIVFTTVLGSIIALVALRTREHFFAIYTLVVGYLIYLVIDKWGDMTGGVRGLIGIPSPDPIGPIELGSDLSMYYLTLTFLLIATLVVYRIVFSLTGRTFIAIRNSEDLAQTIGINTATNKYVSFIISIAFAATSGVLYAALTRFLGPDIANLPMVFEFLMFLIVGGIGTIAGPIVGTLLITWLTEFLQAFQEYRMLIFGPILTLLVIFYPAGIAGAYQQITMRIRNRRRLKKEALQTSNVAQNQQQFKEE